MKTILRKVGKARFLGPAVVVVVALVLVSSLAYAYTTSNLRILKIQEDRFYNYDFDDEGNAVAFIEDFEWGSAGTSLAISGGDIGWRVTKSGSSVAEINTVQHSGAQSARIYRDGSNSVYAYYYKWRPDYIGFYLRKDGTACAEILSGDGTRSIRVRINSDEKLQYDSGSGYQYTWQDTGYTISINTWYRIEFENIDWFGGTYDLYVNGYFKYRLAMHTFWCTPFIYYGSSAGSGAFWIDDIDAPSNTDVTATATMVFDTNAWTSKVKDDIYWGTASPLYASTDYALLNDGDGWIWDGDRGTKKTYTIYIPEIEDWVDVHVHLRVYAPDSTDYMSNSEWGKYVIGTTHCDEGSVLELWYGFNEDAENFLAGYASDEGYTVSEDIIYFNNYEARVELIIHPYWGIPTYYYWFNDGYATVVNVP